MIRILLRAHSWIVNAHMYDSLEFLTFGEKIDINLQSRILMESIFGHVHDLFSKFSRNLRVFQEAPTLMNDEVYRGWGLMCEGHNSGGVYRAGFVGLSEF